MEDGAVAPMPLRVIDVEATIERRERGGIYFTRRQSWHVISHAWSADVREFSKIVGQQLQAADADPQDERRSYEQLFEAANFSDSPSYQRFVDFLMILRADKVRWVWFDAVCINQRDSQEKDKEIQQMGAYYERSLGSYVVHHGIGKGFEVLDVMNTLQMSNQEAMLQSLPRWFSRAWTFQEWVLPQKTTFIIDLASDENLHKTASATMMLSQSKLCLCCHYERTWAPPYLKKCMLHAEARGGELEELSSASESVRALCRYYMGELQHRHFRRVPDRKDWYFADDLGCVFLVRIKLQMKNAALFRPGSDIIIEQKHALNDSEFQLTERLGMKLWLHGMSDYLSEIPAHGSIDAGGAATMPVVIEEISVRDSSNAEDRVLSVLRLLGVEGAVQVRSGKSLDQQIVYLARSLLQKGRPEYNETLLRLCLADGFGNETPGMSWAPNFEVQKGSWQDGGRQLAERMIQVCYFNTFKAQAQVLDLSMAGELQLWSDAVCPGQMICCDHDLRVDKSRSRENELTKPMVLQVGGQVVCHLCARFSAQLTAEACVLEKCTDQSSCIIIRAPRIRNVDQLHHLLFREAQVCNPLREQIPVWLVKMGVGTVHAVYGSVTYFLVCVGDNLQAPLHKIGYVGISLDIVNRCSGLLAESKQTVCLIGGLGRHSTKHLFKETCFCCEYY